MERHFNMRVEDEKHLIVANEQLSSLEDVVRGMPTAQYFNVAFNGISSLSGLEEMKELRSLDVSHNVIESLQEVAMMSKLLVLKCSSNQISDLSWIAGLTCLEELWVQHNRVESAQLAHLQHLTVLQTLVVHPNPCTERDDYVLTTIKIIPWLQRVDTTVVTAERREKARYAEERVALDSGATDCSLFSLLERSKDSRSNEDSSEDRIATPSVPQPPSKNPAKSSKQMTTEEFMRAFPVQEFIPIDNKGEFTAITDNPLTDPEIGDKSLVCSPFIQFHNKKMVIDKGHSTEYDNAPQECQLLPNKKRETKPSALLDSVLTLPTFDDNSFLKKRKSHPHFPGTHRINQRAKPKPAPAQSFTIKHQEYAVGYPNSTVNAIQVRCDGSAIARWSSGTVAVSVNFETSSDHCGYRVYAAHKDGQLALSFDPTGVGFLNAYPSGKTLLSTTSDGNGLLFDIGTGAILRQWDAHGRLRDGMSQSAEALGDESDGSLLCRLSEHLAVRVSLVRSQRVLHEFTDNVDQDCVNPISLQIYFAGAPGIRHVFVNSANRAEHCSEGACDYALGKVLSKVDTTKPVKAKKPMEHNELLNNIRAAVASL